MVKTLAIVGARLNSSRLAGKHLLPLAGEPMIGHIWRRLKECKEVDDFELATTADDFNRPLLEWAEEHQVDCHPYKGDVNDLMGRLDNIIRRNDPDYILYVCGDCPLIDPGFIDHGLRALKSSSKDGVTLKAEIQSLHEGLGFYSRMGWNKLVAASQSSMTKEHVGYADKVSPVLDKLHIEDIADYSRVKHRISVDTDADYRFMSEIYNRWYQNHRADSIVDLKWVQQLLLDTPKLRTINEHVQQKLPEKHYSKINLYCHIGLKIGLGHLKRCAFIAEALQERLGTGTEIFVVGQACELPWLRTKTSWLENDSELFAQLSNDTNRLLVLDFNPSFIDEAALLPICEQIDRKGSSIVAIDKMTSLLPVAKLLFIPSFFTRLHDPKVSFGWDHYLFEKTLRLKKKNLILVLTGGSDALGFGRSLPGVLEQTLHPDWQCIWVQGPLAPAPNITEADKIELAINPTNLTELMASAKIVVTCYGLSFFESMAAKAAVVLLPAQEICEEDELNALKKEDACLVSYSTEEAATLVNHLQSSPEQISELSEKAGLLFCNLNGKSIITQKISAIIDTF